MARLKPDRHPALVGLPESSKCTSGLMPQPLEQPSPPGASTRPPRTACCSAGVEPNTRTCSRSARPCAATVSRSAPPRMARPCASTTRPAPPRPWRESITDGCAHGATSPSRRGRLRPCPRWSRRCAPRSGSGSVRAAARTAADEVAGRRLRGAGQLGADGQLLEKGRRRQVHAVQVVLAAEAHAQRHRVDVQAQRLELGQIAGRVGLARATGAVSRFCCCSHMSSTRRRPARRLRSTRSKNSRGWSVCRWTRSPLLLPAATTSESPMDVPRVEQAPWRQVAALHQGHRIRSDARCGVPVTRTRAGEDAAGDTRRADPSGWAAAYRDTSPPPAGSG